MVAVVPERLADAPPVGAAEGARPPPPGPSGVLAGTITTRGGREGFAVAGGLLAVTITTSGDRKVLPMTADWPPPETTVMVNPLDSKAPMSAVVLTVRVRPRWSVAMPAASELDPASRAGLPGKRGIV